MYNQNSCVIKSAEDFEFQALRRNCELAIKELNRQKQIRQEESDHYEKLLGIHRSGSIFSCLKSKIDFKFTRFESAPSYNGDWQIMRTINSILLTIDSQPHEIHLSCELMADIMFLSSRKD